MLGLVVGARNDAGRVVVTRVVLLDEVRFDPTFLPAVGSRTSSRAFANTDIPEPTCPRRLALVQIPLCRQGGKH